MDCRERGHRGMRGLHEFTRDLVLGIMGCTDVALLRDDAQAWWWRSVRRERRTTAAEGGEAGAGWELLQSGGTVSIPWLMVSWV